MTVNCVMVLVCTFSFWFFIRIRSEKGIASDRIHKVMFALFIFGVLLIVTDPFFENIFICDNGTVIDAPGYWIFLVVPSTMVILMMFTVLKINKREKYRSSMIAYCLVPIVFAILNVFFNRISFTEFVFIINVMVVFGTHYWNRGDEIRRQKLELSVSKSSPHFMFNALSSIINIPGNPPETQEALINFATYLRANIDSIGSDKPILLKKELEIVEAYVDLQKLRFGDKFEISYNIGTFDFKLPALSIETLVENSIKHGILPKNDFGHIYITAAKIEKGYKIVVVDDGIGFDVDAPNPDTSREHVGLENIREKLESISNGTLEITSDLGVGTVATIFIPFE